MANVRIWRLILLVVCSAIAAAGVHWLHKVQVRRHVESYRSEADDALEQGKLAEAVEKLGRSLLISPGKVELYGRMAQLLRHELGKPKEADWWMDRMIQVNPTAPEAFVLRAEYRKELGRLADARRDAIRALKLRPANREAARVISECDEEHLKLQQANTESEVPVQVDSSDPNAYFNLAVSELRAGNRKVAIAWLEKGIRRTGYDRLLEPLADLLVDNEDLEEAQKLLGSKASRSEESPSAAYLRARIDYLRGDWLQAAKTLEQVRGPLASRPTSLGRAEFWLGNCYAQMANRDAQIEAYQRALSVDPSSIVPRAALVEALARDGRLDEAVEHAQKLVELAEDSPAAWIQLSRLLIHKHLRQNEQERDWADVKETIDTADRLATGSVEVLLLRVESLIAQRRLEEAEQVLLDGRNEHADSLDIFMALAALAHRRQDWQRVAQLFEEARSQVGDRVALRLAIGSHVLRRLGNQSPKYLEPLADNVSHFPKHDRLRLWRGLAAMLAQARSYDRAKELCTKCTEEQPDHLPTWQLLLEIAGRRGDVLEMQSILEKIEQIGGHGPDWHYGRALQLRMLAEEDANRDSLHDEALGHLANARQLRPGWSLVPALESEIHQLNKDVDLAIQCCLEAIDLGDRSAPTVNRAVELLRQAGRDAESDELLARLETQQTMLSAEPKAAASVQTPVTPLDRLAWLEENWTEGTPAGIAKAVYALLPQDPGSRTYLDRIHNVVSQALDEYHRDVALLLASSALSIAQEQYEVAEAFLREVLEKDENNVTALNNLAVVLALKKTRLDEALTLVQKAVAIAGPKPTLLDSRATVYRARGQHAEALEDLEKAIGEATRANWHFHKSQVYFEMGLAKESKEALATARELGLDPRQLVSMERSAYRELVSAIEKIPNQVDQMD